MYLARDDICIFLLEMPQNRILSVPLSFPNLSTCFFLEMSHFLLKDLKMLHFGINLNSKRLRFEKGVFQDFRAKVRHFKKKNVIRLRTEKRQRETESVHFWGISGKNILYVLTWKNNLHMFLGHFKEPLVVKILFELTS